MAGDIGEAAGETAHSPGDISEGLWPEGGLSVEVAGVFVGEPNVIGQIRGRPVQSSIAKTAVAAPEMELGLANLDGDRQADLLAHGGPDKAVYVYPSDHYPHWQTDGFDVAVGDLGENVAVSGMTEHEVRIGDIWQWGEALVQVSQPRAPCYKLSLHTGRKDIGPRMLATGRCGWYVRVVEPGTVPTEGLMLLNRCNHDAPTVRQAFAAMFNGVQSDSDEAGLVSRLLALPELADQWRQELADRHKE